MAADLLLGIDIGTSACKAAVFEESRRVFAHTSEDYPVYYPHPGWVEQDPEEWWEAVCRAVRRLLEQNQIQPSRIAGIGIDGQSWSAIPVDREGNCLAKTPIWMDTRARDICSRVNEQVGADRIFEVAGNGFTPSYSTPKMLSLIHIYAAGGESRERDFFHITWGSLQKTGQGYPARSGRRWWGLHNESGYPGCRSAPGPDSLHILRLPYNPRG